MNNQGRGPSRQDAQGPAGERPRLMRPDKRFENAFMISVDTWEYLCRKNDCGTFSVWHHVTPADGGYGQEVRLELAPDYFEQHTVEQFYEHIASLNTKSLPGYVDREKQIEDIRRRMREEKWIR